MPSTQVILVFHTLARRAQATAEPRNVWKIILGTEMILTKLNGLANQAGNFRSGRFCDSSAEEPFVQEQVLKQTKGEGTLRTINHATDEHITTFGYQSFALSPPRRQVHFANTIPSYIPDAPEWSKQEQIFFLQRYDYDYDFPIFPTPFPPSIAHPRLQTTVWLAGLCVMVDADMEAMDGGIAGYRGKKANTNETNNTKTRLEPYRFEANLRANVVRLGGELGGC
ncbi:hypothetical protein BDV97DRAFT_370980 [Delphinella strobiligena]|nr:hypothetical protein BDV97DRAFT_370980 [Delphinella strobiligena]